MKLKKLLKKTVLAFTALLIGISATACKVIDNKDLLDPNNPVTIMIWNYYSGAQANQFDLLVEDFNDTEGKDKGIIVETTAQSNINSLADELIKSVNKEVGASETPDVAAIYPETAYILKQKNAIVAVESYLEDSEWEEYIESFLDTGRFTAEGEIYGFPVSKSTEIIAYNKTDWASFETAKGVSIASIETAEDLVDAAKLYYEWTDSLTAEAEDGKALYGRDSLANYLYIGATRMGHDIATIGADGTANVNLDKETFRTLWNNYYIPYINGYFTAGDAYRSGDMKIGKILAFTGSTSSVNYIAESVTYEDETSHPIELQFAKPVGSKNQEKEVYVQQGASYYVMKSSEAKQYAAAQFLKWFTAKEQNLSFSINVGYSPVKKDANTVEALTEAMKTATKPSEKVLTSLKISAEIFNDNVTYASPAFDNAKDLRSLLETNFENILKKDRAEVVAKIGEGKSRAEAVSAYITEEYFDNWYNSLTAEVEAIVK